MSTTVEPTTKTAAKEAARRELAAADYARYERSEFQNALTRRTAKGLSTDPKVREAMKLLEEDAREHEARAMDLEALADGWDSERATKRAKEERDAFSDLRLLSAKVEESRDAFLAGALDKLVANGPDRPMPSSEFGIFRSQVGSALTLDEAAEKLNKMAARHANTAKHAAVIAEPPPYGESSPHSWFKDLALTVAPDFRDSQAPATRAARDRLGKHGIDVANAISRGGEYGKRARQALFDCQRSDNAEGHERRARDVHKELRAVTTAGGATVAATAGGAAFIPPAFIDALWAPYLQRRPFVNAISVQDIPSWGMQVDVPALITDAAVSQQTEAQLLTESDPVSAFLSAPVATLGGILTISQQLYDRSGGPTGVTYDTVAAKQLAIDLARAQDQQALAAALSSGSSTIVYNGSFALAGTGGVGGFVDKLAEAKYLIRGTAGGYLEPDSVFFTPERWEYLAGWADGQNRPITLPLPVDTEPRMYGDTGQEWGGLHVYTSPNIPSYGTTAEDQVVVTDASEVFFWRSPVPMVQIFPQTNAIQLETVIRLYSYSACIARHSNAVQVISGTALSPITF